MKKLLLCFALLCIAFFPNILYAFEWASNDKDMSIYYLGQIFGHVSTVLKGPDTSLIGDLFRIFNIAVLSLGAIVVSYTIILTTLNTAQEGEVMGKKWSSLWIPLRSAVGMAFLLPSSSGYSLIQILMMSIVIQGINAANQVWFKVADGFVVGTGFSGKTSITPEGQIQKVAEALFYGMVCAEVANNSEDCNLIGEAVTPYIKGNLFIIGTSAKEDYKQLCGGLEIAAAPAFLQDQASWQTANIAAFNAALPDLKAAAEEVIAQEDFTRTNVISSAMSTIKATLLQAPQAPVASAGCDDPKAPLTVGADIVACAKQYGWLFAGSYYFQLISSSRDQQFPGPSVLPRDASAAGTVTCKTALSLAYKNAADYLTATTIVGTSSTGSTSSGSKMAPVSIQPTGGTPDAAAFYDSITAPLRLKLYEFFDYLSGGEYSTVTVDMFTGQATVTHHEQKDPLAALRKVGSDIMITCEAIWIGVMIAGLIALLAGCTMSGQLPFCWMLGAMITVLVPILTMIIVLLWGVGALLGVYIPLVPYLVYTFTALGWFVLVIETIVAAPVVALGLVSPAVETLGRASPAVLLITNVFLRPSLMVIGFVAAAKLVRVLVGMLNFGFQATVEASVTGLGIFGLIALLTLYGGLVLAIIHEAFSLIHVLPDKVIRWIGGQAEHSGVEQKMQEAQKSVEKGAAIGGDMMKGSAQMMGKVGKESMGGGGGPPGGGGGGGAPGGKGGGGAPGGKGGGGGLGGGGGGG